MCTLCKTDHSTHLIGTRLSEKLLNHLKLTHIDNQEKLRMLVPMNDDFPLKDCLSREKVVPFFPLINQFDCKMVDCGMLT